MSTWKTKGGAILPIHTMQNDHLISCIQLLRKRAVPVLFLEALKAHRQAEQAPDGAAMAIEEWASQIMNIGSYESDQLLSEKSSVFCALLNEIHKRKLVIPTQERKLG